MGVVEVCNIGLSQYLGYERMNDINEGTPQAEECNLHYNAKRKSLLEMHWWFFAKGHMAMALVTNDRTDQWAYKYELPADIVDIHWINDPVAAQAAIEAQQDPDAPRHMSGVYVYTNVRNAYIEFTRNIKNTNLMPQYFQDAWSAMIAAAVALPLTESVSKARFATEQAEIMIDRAIAADEQRTGSVEMPQSDYISARTGNTPYAAPKSPQGFPS